MRERERKNIDRENLFEMEYLKRDRQADRQTGRQADRQTDREFCFRWCI